ncbi:MAG: nitroreductase family protein, partial [Rhodospirillales bacterium]|nr:nitroreductase family protein [Rhodospirillales bacterium]
MHQPPRFDEAFRHTFEQLVVWRRDVRRFLRDPLPAGMVERLVALSCLAPSVGNAQPWRFVKV